MGKGFIEGGRGGGKDEFEQANYPSLMTSLSLLTPLIETRIYITIITIYGRVKNHTGSPV